MRSACGERAECWSPDELVTLWGNVVEGYARTARLLENDIAEATGLPPTWFEVLLRLVRSADHRLPLTRLAREVSFTSGGFTKLTDRLVQAGFLERQPCQGDRRVTYAVLTEEGARVIDEARRVHCDSLRRRVLSTLAPDELEALSGLMRRLRDGPGEQGAGLDHSHQD